MKKDSGIGETFSGVSAAKYLGISRHALRSLTEKGRIKPLDIGGRPVFTKESLDALKRERFATGLGHREIAEMYGRPRTNVVYHFKRINVPTVGSDNMRRGAAIYTLAAVQDAAKLLGWELVQQNPTNAVPTPDPVSA